MDDEFLPHDVILLSPSLEDIIHLDHDHLDDLDSSHFSTIEYLNQLFPNEASLSTLDSLLENLKIYIQQIDRESSQKVIDETETSLVNEQRMREVRESIKVIFIQ